MMKPIFCLVERAFAYRKQADELIEQAIKRCKHPKKYVVEICEKSRVTEEYDRPYRVCTRCGYAEEGWGCGYWKLAPNIAVRSVRRKEVEYINQFNTQEMMNKKRYKKYENISSKA